MPSSTTPSLGAVTPRNRCGTFNHRARVEAETVNSKTSFQGDQHETAHAETILRGRLDAGTPDEADFDRRLAVLRARPNGRRAGVIVMLAIGGLVVAAAAAGLAYDVAKIRRPASIRRAHHVVLRPTALWPGCRCDPQGT